MTSTMPTAGRQRYARASCSGWRRRKGSPPHILFSRSAPARSGRRRHQQGQRQDPPRGRLQASLQGQVDGRQFRAEKIRPPQKERRENRELVGEQQAAAVAAGSNHWASASSRYQQEQQDRRHRAASQAAHDPRFWAKPNTNRAPARRARVRYGRPASPGQGLEQAGQAGEIRRPPGKARGLQAEETGAQQRADQRGQQHAAGAEGPEAQEGEGVESARRQEPQQGQEEPRSGGSTCRTKPGSRRTSPRPACSPQ